MSFLFCGIAFIAYIVVRFKNKNLYPSIIFCLMWALNCFFHLAIRARYVNPLVDVENYDYSYMDTYIIYFTLASLIGFSLAHQITNDNNVNLKVSPSFLNRLLSNYKWIMWFNFFGGILRIILMINLVGFDLYDIISYRVAANHMVVSATGFVGFVFRITAYIVMLANLYVLIAGFYAGLNELKMRNAMTLFVLYAPTQLATGGRLFILFYVIFYFGGFFLARGFRDKQDNNQWLSHSEKMIIWKIMLILFSLVAIISITRGEGGVQNLSAKQGTILDPFTYFTDGTMLTDNCMRYFSEGSYSLGWGQNTFLGHSYESQLYDEYLTQTRLWSSVYTVIVPLFLDFGYWGSLIVWSIFAFAFEYIAIVCMRNMTLINVFISCFLLRMLYTTIMGNPIAGSIPYLELFVILFIFQKYIFGQIKE